MGLATLNVPTLSSISRVAFAGARHANYLRAGELHARVVLGDAGEERRADRIHLQQRVVLVQALRAALGPLRAAVAARRRRW